VDEEEKIAAGTPKNGNLPSRMLRWLDKRTGVQKLMEESLDEPIPGGARLAYVFGSGLLFIFISQIITGVCLALYYVPSAETAHASVAYITKQVAAGAFLRSLHYYGSSAMIIVLLLHFLQTFLYGSFKGRRELLWISGAVLSLIVLGMGFTGYLLPWDQKAYFATAVGTNIVGQIPFFGNWLTRLLRGGDTIGTLTLSRFYVAHVFLLPAAIFAFIAAHIVLFRKAGPAGPIKEDPINPKLRPEGFYPRQVIMDMAFALLIMVGLGILSYFHPASLGPIANPADTLFLPRPEWYYLPMFEWLKFWEGPKVVFAVVVVPGILAMLFFLLPFLDRRLERRPWRRPIPVLSVAIVVAGMVYLGAKSHRDDMRDPGVAAQLATQDQQEKAYTAAPFEPFIESAGGTGPVASPSGSVNPLVAQGKGIFEAHGCSGCHGETGMGSPAATGVVGVTTKFPEVQLVALLHNPNAKMRAGHMPAVDISSTDMSALLAYLGALGTSAANVPPVFTVPPSQISAPAFSARGKTSVSSTGAPLSATAAAGEQIYRERGCLACHGPAGAGGRAPAVAPLISGISNAHLVQVLENPNAKMKTGGMQAVAGTPEQMGSLVAYLRTLSAPQPGTQVIAQTSGNSATPPTETVAVPNTSAAPTAPNTPPSGAATATVETTPTAGRALFVAQGCAACHGSTAQGTRFAPSLIDIATRFPGDKLSTLLHHPTSKMRDGGMPAVTVNDSQMQQLVAYMSGLKPTSAELPNPLGGPSVRTGAAQPVKGEAAVNSTATVHAAVPIPLSALASRGQQVFLRNSCQTCHGVGGVQGTVAAPGLAGTASILPASTLENLLRHHSIQMQKGGMPLTNMNARDMQALVAYVRSMPAVEQ
jgi:ubiquinol-cytochrome c reductase cytochrome b subunit